MKTGAVRRMVYAQVDAGIIRRANFLRNSEAIFSPCERYRYYLKRKWDDGRPLVNFLMLNPSTADESKNDPTVERCCQRAERLGFGGLIVTNVFAWRATDPNELAFVDDPVGPENDDWIARAADESEIVICAWGGHGNLNGRAAAVKAMLPANKLHWLKFSERTDTPYHPLYLRYDIQPKPWIVEASQ